MKFLNVFIAGAAVLTLGCSPKPGDRGLLKAAENGDAAKVKSLLAKGVNPNATNKVDWTAMMFAAKNGHRAVVEALLDGGANPNLESKRIVAGTTVPYPQSTALREAVGEGHIAIAMLLIDRGATVDVTSFAKAGGAGDVSLLEKMVAKGAKPNTVDPLPNRYNTSVLVTASFEGHLEAVKWLVENGADVNFNAKGSTALRSAITGDHLKVVEYLLEQGADPNVETFIDKATPLLHAIRMHTRGDRYDPNLLIIKALLKAGADPKYRSTSVEFGKRTAIEFASDERGGASSSAVAAKLDGIVKLLEEAD